MSDVALAANPKEQQELGRFQAVKGKTWNHSVIAQGRIYLRNAEEMACYELPYHVQEFRLPGLTDPALGNTGDRSQPPACL